MTTTTPPNRKKHVLGPGSLILGDVGTPLDLSCQVTNIVVAAEGDSEDPVYTLCGNSEAGERTYAWTLSITAFQDVDADGIIDYTWKHAGTQVPFTFKPDLATGAQVDGNVIIDPVQLGGDVKVKNTSEAEWQITGTPTFTPAGSGDTETTNPEG